MHEVSETYGGTRRRVLYAELRKAWPEVGTKTTAKRQVRVSADH